MRRTAAGIILVGFVFIFFRLSFMGIDLLIDAVGFLFLFNGARALKKIDRAEAGGFLAATPASGKNAIVGQPVAFSFGAAQSFAILLVVVSALGMFLTAVPGMVVGVLRAALELLLFLCLLRGFSAMPSLAGHAALRRLVPLALVLAMAASGLSALFLSPPAPYSPGVLVCRVFVLAAHIFVLGVFLWLVVCLKDTSRAKK